jgi:hypothetical protein
MGWYEDNGFDMEPRGSRVIDDQAGGGVPVYTPQPIQTQGGPQATAPAGMTIADAARIGSDPTNARLSSGGGGSEPFSEDAFFNFMEQYPPTNEGMRAGYEAAKAKWGSAVPELLEHPQRLDKFRFADGRTFDVIGGAGGPNPSWVRNLEGPGHGGGSVGALGAMQGGNWQAGMDPSYGFRFAEGQKALERSAAAKGTILTGGTLKALAAYGQGLASTEFGNIFNRNYQLAGLGLNAAQSGAQAGTSYSGQTGNMAANQAQNTVDLTTGAANANSAATAVNGAGWGNTIGQLGAIVAPDAAGWLKGRGGKASGMARSDYLTGREGTV